MANGRWSLWRLCNGLLVRSSSSSHLPSTLNHGLWKGHNEVLRHALHMCQTQLTIEGHKLNVSHILADCVFNKNALPSIGEGTPGIALYGRVPQLLPQLEHIVGTSHLDGETGIGGHRHAHRLRGIMVSSMVEALVERRLTMINQTGPAPLPGELLWERVIRWEFTVAPPKIDPLGSGPPQSVFALWNTTRPPSPGRAAALRFHSTLPGVP